MTLSPNTAATRHSSGPGPERPHLGVVSNPTCGTEPDVELAGRPKESAGPVTPAPDALSVFRTRLTALKGQGYFEGLPAPLWELLYSGGDATQLPRNIRFREVSPDFPIAEAGAGYHSRLTGNVTVFSPLPSLDQVSQSLSERGTLPPEFFTLAHELAHASQKIPGERYWRFAGYAASLLPAASIVAFGPASLVPALGVWAYILHKGGHFARWMGDTALAREMHAVQASLCTPWSWGTREYRDQYIDAVLGNLGGKHSKAEAVSLFNLIDGLKLMGVSDTQIGVCLGPVQMGKGAFSKLKKLSLDEQKRAGLSTNEQYERWLTERQDERDRHNELLRHEARRLFIPPAV